MMPSIRSGVYPTMITPYTQDNRIDQDAVDSLVAYYTESGCDGIFALCLSSEIFHLTEDEKRLLLRRVVSANAGRLQIVASGHTADDLPGQIRQLAMAAEEGADASVIILNRTAAQGEDEDVCRRHIEALLQALPDVRFGIYESPYPYKRVASPDLMRWCAETGRIVFLKDTCCDIVQLKAKQAAVAGTQLKIYNANTATLLASMRLGIAGYSGVMANFHADLYTRLISLHRNNDSAADKLQAFLTVAAWAEYQLYPVNAKAYRAMLGMDIGITSRTKDADQWTGTFESELRQLHLVEQEVRALLGGTP